MLLEKLQQHIVKNQLLQFYVFTGEEVGIMDIYLNKIAEVSGAEKIRMDSCMETWPKLIKKGFSKQPKLYIIRDDKDFLKDEKLQQKIRSGWLPFVDTGSTYSDYVVVIYTTLDKRGKFYKSFQEDIIEFSKLGPEVLEKYILKELPGLSKKDCTYLAEVCDCDYSRILLECDKIRYYGNATQMQYGAALRYLVDRGVIYKPIGDITFKFTDAILTRNTKATAEYLLQAKAKSEPEIMILSILYNGFKQILMVQGLGNDQSDASKRTGLTPFQIKLAKEKQGHYSTQEIIKALKIIRDTEKGIKTGGIDADIAMEYVIVNIM
jgi:DNA polymerase III delta subunit